MSKYLFLFTVGPVQSFIAQARKTQDLYAGSQILSQLVIAGIKKVPKWKDNLIFPYFEDDGDGDVKSLPNRFIAIVEKEEKSLKTIGKEIEQAVRGEFESIAKKALSREAKYRNESFDELYFNQIRRHLDIHWVFNKLGSDYKKSYKDTEALLGSIKNIRPFEQFGDNDQLGEAGRKCSLDGENNALFFGRKQPTLGIKKQRNEAINLEGFLSDEKEGLSAVSFVKRYGVRASKFQSTAQITVQHDEDNLQDDKKEILNCYRNLFDKKKVPEVCAKLLNANLVSRINLKSFDNNDNWNTHFDYQPLFEENLTKKTFPDEDQLVLARILQRKLSSSFKTRYYALILFDGDKMGEKLGKASKYEQHRDFSKALSVFAEEARKILADKGQTIYTGGDDFLGFVNLHNLFEVMSELRKQFKTFVSDKAKEILGLQEEFTFSAGIVIAHYKMPLSEVLKTARKVEKKAKNDGNRNAFCITAMKHSGEIQETVMKWGDEENMLKNWEALAYIYKQLRNNTFSNKFITSLTLEMYQLAGIALNEIGIKPNQINVEFKRLAKRALIEKKDKATNTKRVDDLVERISLLYASSRSVDVRTKNFVHALHIADFLSRKTN